MTALGASCEKLRHTSALLTVIKNEEKKRKKMKNEKSSEREPSTGRPASDSIVSFFFHLMESTNFFSATHNRLACEFSPDRLDRRVVQPPDRLHQHACHTSVSGSLQCSNENTFWEQWQDIPSPCHDRPFHCTSVAKHLCFRWFLTHSTVEATSKEPCNELIWVLWSIWEFFILQRVKRHFSSAYI